MSRDDSMIAIAMLLLISANGADAVDHWAKVNGVRYRVRVKDDQFVVFKKAAVTHDTLPERDAQREAVRIATGCEPVDELHRDARLRGKLKCPSSPE